MVIHYGLVSAVQYDPPRIRVTLPDRDSLPTDWLPFLQPYGTRTNKHFSLPDEGEQVAVLLDKHCNAGVVLGSIYSSEDTPDADSSGAGVYALKLVQDGAAVFLAKVQRAAAGIFSLWSKSGVTITTAGGNIEATAGGQLKLNSIEPLAVTAGGETLHKLLHDLVSYLTTQKHQITPTVATLSPSPADLLTLAQLLVRIEKFTQD